MDRDFLHNQLVKLGDMMGDGLHHESDGKWIEKEYSKIFNQLYPEHKKELRKKKADRINEQIKNLLETKTCPCGGKLKQSRSGSIILYCEVCDNRFKAVTNKKK